MWAAVGKETRSALQRAATWPHKEKQKTPGPSCSKRRQHNERVKGHFVDCFSIFNIQYSDIFAAKATHIFFSKKFQHICVSLDVNFNESLTNDIVNFEQLSTVLERSVAKKYQEKVGVSILLTAK